MSDGGSLQVVPSTGVRPHITHRLPPPVVRLKSRRRHVAYRTTLQGPSERSVLTEFECSLPALGDRYVMCVYADEDEAGVGMGWGNCWSTLQNIMSAHTS